MLLWITLTKKWLFIKTSVLITLLCWVLVGFSYDYSKAFAGDYSELLPEPSKRLSLSSEFVPVSMRGLSVDSHNPFNFTFILDTGTQGDVPDDELKIVSDKLIKYFMAALTIPQDELWVNLSPYEKERISSDTLAVTDMGADMLSQDYILKQITASVMYPESELGRNFWDKVIAEVYKKYKTTNLPIDTFNKVWVVPDRAVVYEDSAHVYVGERMLKVMLANDYLALKESQINSDMGYSNNMPTSDITDKIMREIILPAIEKEVNTGENFRILRQIYDAAILAKWFKEKLRRHIVNEIYSDKAKVTGIDLKDKNIKKQVYERYLTAYKEGVYDYIRTDIEPETSKRYNRRYISGGVDFSKFEVDREPIVLMSKQPVVGKTVEVNADIEGVSSSVITKFNVISSDQLFKLVSGEIKTSYERDVLIKILLIAEGAHSAYYSKDDLFDAKIPVVVQLLKNKDFLAFLESKNVGLISLGDGEVLIYSKRSVRRIIKEKMKVFETFAELAGLISKIDDDTALQQIMGDILFHDNADLSGAVYQYSDLWDLIINNGEFAEEGHSLGFYLSKSDKPVFSIPVAIDDVDRLANNYSFILQSITGHESHFLVTRPVVLDEKVALKRLLADLDMGNVNMVQIVRADKSDGFHQDVLVKKDLTILISDVFLKKIINKLRGYTGTDIETQEVTLMDMFFADTQEDTDTESFAEDAVTVKDEVMQFILAVALLPRIEYKLALDLVMGTAAVNEGVLRTKDIFETLTNSRDSIAKEYGISVSDVNVVDTFIDSDIGAQVNNFEAMRNLKKIIKTVRRFRRMDRDVGDNEAIDELVLYLKEMQDLYFENNPGMVKTGNQFIRINRDKHGNDVIIIDDISLSVFLDGLNNGTLKLNPDMGISEKNLWKYEAIFLQRILREVAFPLEEASRVDAINYKGENWQGEGDVWKIVSFGDIFDDKIYEHERLEIKYRKQGYSWRQAHNKAVEDTGYGVSITEDLDIDSAIGSSFRDEDNGEKISSSVNQQIDNLGGIDFNMDSFELEHDRLRLDDGFLSHQGEPLDLEEFKGFTFHIIRIKKNGSLKEWFEI